MPICTGDLLIFGHLDFFWQRELQFSQSIPLERPFLLCVRGFGTGKAERIAKYESVMAM